MLINSKISFLILTFIGINLYAQNKELFFTPEWKVGDKRTANIVREEKSSDNGVSERDTVIKYTETFEVLTDANDVYTVKLVAANPVVDKAVTIYSGLYKDIASYKNVTVKFSVEKKTGKATIANWKEVRTYMKTSITKVQEIAQKKAPDYKDDIKGKLGEINVKLSDEQTTVELFEQSTYYYFLPFGKKFAPGDTLKSGTAEGNPMGQGDSIRAVKKTFISNLNKDAKSVDIISDYDVDMTPLMKALLSFMEPLLKMTEDGAAKLEKLKKGMIMEVKRKETISFNYKVGFPTNVVETLDSNMEMDEKKKKTSIKRTVTFK